MSSIESSPAVNPKKRSRTTKIQETISHHSSPLPGIPSKEAVSSPSAAPKPLARPVIVCKRCRSKKIKCDQNFPSCRSCVKAGEECVGLDPATGREVSRSYVCDLENQLDQLHRENAQLQHRLASINQRTDATTLDNTVLIHSPKPQFGCLSNGPTNRDNLPRPLKRQSTGNNPFDPSAPRPSAGLSGSFLDSVGAASETDSLASALRPSLRQLNSYASGLSPARLLCQAIQQSAQAGLRIRDSARSLKAASIADAAASSRRHQLRVQDSNSSNSVPISNNNNNNKSVNNTPARDLPVNHTNRNPSLSASLNLDRLVGNRQQPENLSLPSGTQDGSGTVSPSFSSGAVTLADSKKTNSLMDDADPMQYAKATETSDITVPAPEQLSKPSPRPAPFPPLHTARKLVDAYFERVNPQLPILDRTTFMSRFEKACKEGLAKAIAKLESNAESLGKELGDINEDEVEIELQPADGHLFHLVLAIAAAMGWTRSIWSAENHHEAAMRFLDPRRNANNGQAGSGVGAIMGRDSLEQLQCLLLATLYSIMRAMKPGVWYCLGVALRLTTGLGLYTESPGILESTATGNNPSDVESLAEKKRRLFWCAYALDRQVCVHLARPFGLADTDIKVNLPWINSEDEMLEYEEWPARLKAAGKGLGNQATTCLNHGGEKSTDASFERKRNEAASTLAALGETVCDGPSLRVKSNALSLPIPKQPSRWVSLSFFQMRILQSEIQSILNQNAELPRRYESLEHWKSDALDRLAAWRRYAPSSKAELEKAGCGYNPIFLELNFQQTLLMVYGLSPRFPCPTRDDLAHVEDCSRTIVEIYALLAKEGQMNYTWMTGHNVFIACTSYLYAIWQISATAPSSIRCSMSPGFKSKVDEIEHFASLCDKVLASLQWFTAEKCRKCLRTMFSATMMVVEKIDRAAAAAAAAITTTVARGTGADSDRATIHVCHASNATGRQTCFDGRAESSQTNDSRLDRLERFADKEIAPKNASISARSLYSQVSRRTQPTNKRLDRLLPVPRGTPTTRYNNVEGHSAPANYSNGFYPQVEPPLAPSLPHLSAGPPFNSHAANQRSVNGSSAAGGQRQVDDIEAVSLYSSSSNTAGVVDSGPQWQVGRLQLDKMECPDDASQGRLENVESISRYQEPHIGTASMAPDIGQSHGYDMADPVATNLYNFEFTASPDRMLGGNTPTGSPTTFDLSTLMVTSAMELDQLFSEAGMHIGGDGSSANFNTSVQEVMSQPRFASTKPQQLYAARPSSSAHIHHLIHRNDVDLSSAPMTGSDGFLGSHDPIDYSRNGADSSDDGFENDWEALGFGFRMAYPADVDQFDGVTTQAVELRNGFQQPYQQQQQPSFPSCSFEFDQHQLDSNAGF